MIKTTNKTLMTLMTFLFFMWGFITCLNDILVPHLKILFSLNYTQALLIQFCFFMTYAVMSIPMSKLVGKLGYKIGILSGLVIASVGCLLFLPAASYKVYPLFLLGLFVLATGIVILQVAANPCVTLLGEPFKASSRLTFAQGINSLGYTVAPILAGSIILIYSVQIPYLSLAIVLLLLALIIAMFAFPDFDNESSSNLNASRMVKASIWQHPQLIFGAVAIFLYVGAEVSTGSLLVNYLGLPNIAAMPASVAAKYLSVYWGGAMIGRFIGSGILTRIAPQRVVTFNAAMACLLLIVSLIANGYISMWSILVLGIFNSVMFPTIFALAIAGLGKFRQQATGILCTAIVGGAIIPELQGLLADHIGLKNSFFLLIFCYLIIAGYGLIGYKKR